VRVVNLSGPATDPKLHDAGFGLAVDLGLVAVDAGSAPQQRRLRTFQARGAALNGLVSTHDMLVSTYLQRRASHIQAPGPLLDTTFSLIQALLTSVSAGLPLIGHLFATVGELFTLVSQASTLLSDRVTAIGNLCPPLLLARTRLTVTAEGPHGPRPIHPSTVTPNLG
jgi:hypothetical protein